jgi:hypothetical protein
VLDGTSRHFDLTEVLADKAYSSQKNLQAEFQSGSQGWDKETVDNLIKIIEKLRQRLRELRDSADDGDSDSESTPDVEQEVKPVTK